MKICLICGSKRKRLVRDHDHRTGFIRGILCELCNSWLGLVEGGKQLSGRSQKWYGRYKNEIREHLGRNTGVKYVRFPNVAHEVKEKPLPVVLDYTGNPWGVTVTKLPPGDARGSRAWMGRRW